jgi:hypothetical protein
VMNEPFSGPLFRWYNHYHGDSKTSLLGLFLRINPQMPFTMPQGFEFLEGIDFAVRGIEPSLFDRGRYRKI